MYQLIQAVGRNYTGIAFAVTVLAGLLTIMVERFLYMRRGYRREAQVTAVIGWSYIVGGSLLYLIVGLFK